MRTHGSGARARAHAAERCLRRTEDPGVETRESLAGCSPGLPTTAAGREGRGREQLGGFCFAPSLGAGGAERRRKESPGAPARSRRRLPVSFTARQLLTSPGLAGMPNIDFSRTFSEASYILAFLPLVRP